MWVAQKVLQHFCAFSRKCVQFFSWLILNIPLATAAPRNNFSHTCTEGSQKVFWYGDDVVSNNGMLLKPRWTVIPHPPYKLYITPSDFHLFGPLLDTMCGKSVIMVTYKLIEDILLCY